MKILKILSESWVTQIRLTYIFVSSYSVFYRYRNIFGFFLISMIFLITIYMKSWVKKAETLINSLDADAVPRVNLPLCQIREIPFRS